MLHAAPDDLPLLAERLRFGIPLVGLDGRMIPLRDRFGQPVPPIQAARELLDSGASLLDPADASGFVADTLARAREIETAACLEGVDGFGITARVAAVLVSAAVRARAIARQRDVSPSEINRATLSWYQLHQLQRRALFDRRAHREPARALGLAYDQRRARRRAGVPTCERIGRGGSVHVDPDRQQLPRAATRLDGPRDLRRRARAHLLRDRRSRRAGRRRLPIGHIGAPHGDRCAPASPASGPHRDRDPRRHRGMWVVTASPAAAGRATGGLPTIGRPGAGAR